MLVLRIRFGGLSVTLSCNPKKVTGTTQNLQLFFFFIIWFYQHYSHFEVTWRVLIVIKKRVVLVLKGFGEINLWLIVSGRCGNHV